MNTSLKPDTETPFIFRAPGVSDGKKLFEIAKRSGTLDINSLYHYLIMSSHFSDTGLIAERGPEIAGFVTGYSPPRQPDTLFVWQVAVEKKFQGSGLGKRLLKETFFNNNRNYRYLEASITPSNTASLNLFTSVASDFGSPYTFETPFFTETDFGDYGHEAEILFRTGPIKTDSISGE